MVNFILIFLALIPTILGLSEILHYIRIVLMSPKKRPTGYLVVFLEPLVAEEQLKYIIEKYSWENVDFGKIVAIPKGLCENELNACRILAEKYGIEFNKSVI